MNDLQIFNSDEFGEVRALEIDGEPWFVAADVCRILEIQNTTQALERLDDDERSIFNIGRQGNANVVNESGLYALVLTSEDAIPVTVIAKEYGMSGVTFNKLLNSEQIQYVREGVWLLYRKYDGRGYTVTQTLNVNGLNRMYTRWTQKGREFIYYFLKARGIVPVRERVEPMATLF